MLDLPGKFIGIVVAFFLCVLAPLVNITITQELVARRQIITAATNLLDESGVKVDPVEFAERLNVKIKQQVELLNQYGFSAVRTRWKQCAYMLGKKLKMRDSGIVLFEDIDDDGNMIVKKENDEKSTILSSDDIECNAE